MWVFSFSIISSIIVRGLGLSFRTFVSTFRIGFSAFIFGVFRKNPDFLLGVSDFSEFFRITSSEFGPRGGSTDDDYNKQNTIF